MKLNQMSKCKCPGFTPLRDVWFYGEHFCEDGVRIEPWTRIKSKVERERELCGKINEMMEKDGFEAPKIGMPNLEAFQLIHDYIVSIRKESADGISSI